MLLTKDLDSQLGWSKAWVKLGGSAPYPNRQRHLPGRVRAAFELKSGAAIHPLVFPLSLLEHLCSLKHLPYISYEGQERIKQTTWERVKGPNLSEIFTLPGTS